ncbi:MAG: hypothetical protein ACD_73C00632G0001 [uncultured bacterium]|nr:MAG: hypothetical protein ACD_73C00632G0001 [uncultured bacterium]
MKKNREIMQIQVGAFVAIGLALTMMVIFLLGSEKKLFERQYTLIAHFEDISGLRLGAPVQLAGINVGTVNQISFDDDLSAKKVKLRLLISHPFKDRIRSDSEATIVTQGLLGDKMILISVGSNKTGINPLEDGDELKTKNPTGFTQMMEEGHNLLGKADHGVDHVNDILKELKEGRGLIHELIYSPRGKELLGNAGDLTHNLENASARIDNILTKIDEGQGTLGALVNDASVFNDIKTLLGKANRNKLIKAVVRETLKTRDEKLLLKENPKE